MTEFQYLFLTSVISDIQADGVDVPNWNSDLWIKKDGDTGEIHMIWLGADHVVTVTIDKEHNGTYEVGNVTWIQKDM